MHVQTISTGKAPEAGGHYAQATVYGDLVFVSGQLPIDPADPKKAAGNMEEQAEQVLRNVAAILEAAGSGLPNVLKTTLYIADISMWGKVNEVYARVFGKHRPAWAVIPCNELHYGYLIEMEAIAYIPG